MLLIINKGPGLHVVRGDLLAATTRTGLSSEDILWALEEYNRCDVGEWIVIREDYDADRPV